MKKLLLFCLLSLVASCMTTDEKPLPRQMQWGQNNMAWDFRHMDEYFPVRMVAAGENTTPLRKSNKPFEISYEYEGNTYTLADYIERNQTTGLIILKSGEILHESYHQGATPNSRFTSWSVAKSVTATLVGFAREDGLISSFDDKVVKYLPELEATAYKDVTVKQALQMASGVAFTEEYEEGESDVWIFVRDWTSQGKANEYLLTRTEQAHPPGEMFNYNSSESQVLSWLVTRVTGKSMSEYLSEKIWQPAGMEADAFWTTDAPGGEETGGMGLNARLRDYARFGLLHTRQLPGILRPNWVTEATTPSDASVEHYKLYEGSPLGYQYQWWSFPNGAFEAQGIHGQFVYVNRDEDLVVAQNSAWPEAWVFRSELEFYALMEAIEDATR